MFPKSLHHLADENLDLWHRIQADFARQRAPSEEEVGSQARHACGPPSIVFVPKKKHGIPVQGLDHVQPLTRCRLALEVIPGCRSTHRIIVGHRTKNGIPGSCLRLLSLWIVPYLCQLMVCAPPVRTSCPLVRRKSFDRTTVVASTWQPAAASCSWSPITSRGEANGSPPPISSTALCIVQRLRDLGTPISGRCASSSSSQV